MPIQEPKDTPAIQQARASGFTDWAQSSAAAASVIAKVARDALMTELHEEAPAYNWARNKGYASPDHRDAILEHGISRHHRASWSFIGSPTLF